MSPENCSLTIMVTVVMAEVFTWYWARSYLRDVLFRLIILILNCQKCSRLSSRTSDAIFNWRRSIRVALKKKLTTDVVLLLGLALNKHLSFFHRKPFNIWNGRFENWRALETKEKLTTNRKSWAWKFSPTFTYFQARMAKKWITRLSYIILPFCFENQRFFIMGDSIALR